MSEVNHDTVLSIRTGGGNRLHRHFDPSVREHGVHDTLLMMQPGTQCTSLAKGHSFDDDPS